MLQTHRRGCCPHKPDLTHATHLIGVSSDSRACAAALSSNHPLYGAERHHEIHYLTHCLVKDSEGDDYEYVVPLRTKSWAYV